MVGNALPIREKLKNKSMSINVIINFVLYEIAWFASVLGAANNLPWLGVHVITVVLIWHFINAQNAGLEVILLMITLLIGGLFDQLLLSTGLISYESHGWSIYLVPAWILTMWAGFVTLLNVSLRWMKKRWISAIIFGAIGGPLAYIGAAKLGAVTINHLPLSYVALSVGWAIITPLLLILSDKFDGFKSVEFIKR